MFTREKAEEIYNYLTKEKPFEFTMVQVQEGNSGYMVIIQ